MGEGPTFQAGAWAEQRNAGSNEPTGFITGEATRRWTLGGSAPLIWENDFLFSYFVIKAWDLLVFVLFCKGTDGFH